MIRISSTSDKGFLYANIVGGMVSGQIVMVSARAVLESPAVAISE